MRKHFFLRSKEAKCIHNWRIGTMSRCLLTLLGVDLPGPANLSLAGMRVDGQLDSHLPFLFPLIQPDAHKKKLESATARAERLAAEAELAKALEEEGDDGDIDGYDGF